MSAFVWGIIERQIAWYNPAYSGFALSISRIVVCGALQVAELSTIRTNPGYYGCIRWVWDRVDFG